MYKNMATSLNKMSVCKEPHEMALDLLDGKITLGFLRPSQLLDRMYQSVPPGEEESFFFCVLFIKQLPPNIRSELYALKDVSLRELAKVADNLLPTTNIMDLPREILEMIFKNAFSSTKDIVSCINTCVKWKNQIEAMYKDKGIFHNYTIYKTL